MIPIIMERERGPDIEKEFELINEALPLAKSVYGQDRLEEILQELAKLWGLKYEENHPLIREALLKLIGEQDVLQKYDDIKREYPASEEERSDELSFKDPVLDATFEKIPIGEPLSPLQMTIINYFEKFAFTPPTEDETMLFRREVYRMTRADVIKK